MAEHTPTGLVVGRTFNTHNHPTRCWETDINDDLNRIIATTSGESQAEAEANAALIVKAVNSHPAMVKALEKAEELYKVGLLNAPDGLATEVALLRRAALACVEGER